MAAVLDQTRAENGSLDEMEIENLVSFLVGKEDAFECLHKLHLPAPPHSTTQDPLNLILPDPEQLDIEELLTYHDALYYQPNETLSPLFSLSHTPLLQQIDTPLFNYPNEPDSGSCEQTRTPPEGIELLRDVVLHDHTYSAKGPVAPQSAMLTTVGSNLSCDLNGRVSDDNEEGNSSDGGEWVW